MASPRAQALVEQFDALSEDEQELVFEQIAARVAEHIAPSLALHPTWKTELHERVRAFQNGTVALHDWHDVERELQDIIEK